MQYKGKQLAHSTTYDNVQVSKKIDKQNYNNSAKIELSSLIF